MYLCTTPLEWIRKARWAVSKHIVESYHANVKQRGTSAFFAFIRY
ncbi:DUF2080 family transposase-associated protein [Paenibacillus lemnae]